MAQRTRQLPRTATVQRIGHRQDEIHRVHAFRLAIQSTVQHQELADPHTSRHDLPHPTQDQGRADARVQAPHPIHHSVRLLQPLHHARIHRWKHLVHEMVSFRRQVQDPRDRAGQRRGALLAYPVLAARTAWTHLGRMADGVLAPYDGSIVQLRPQRDAILPTDRRQHVRFRRDPTDPGIHEDRRFHASKEGACAGEEEVSHRTVGKTEPLAAVTEYLGMKVDQERSDGVLVRFRDAVP
eukprot:scaffold1214_cov311-Pavlova_lutheri.AAC.8